MQITGHRKRAISLVITLKGPDAELLQKVPPDSLNICDELINALELRYDDDEHLHDVYYACLLYTSRCV